MGKGRQMSLGQSALLLLPACFFHLCRARGRSSQTYGWRERRPTSCGQPAASDNPLGSFSGFLSQALGPITSLSGVGTRQCFLRLPRHVPCVSPSENWRSLQFDLATVICRAPHTLVCPEPFPTSLWWNTKSQRWTLSPELKHHLQKAPC